MKTDDTRLAGVATHNVRDYGAIGDGKTLDTAAIQAAIDACEKNQGGTVLVPTGAYLTGTLRLRSNVELQLAPTATILGSTNPADYATGIARCGFVNESNIDKCLIYGENLRNVSITGRGTIDGQGASFPAVLPDGTRGDRPMLTRLANSERVLFEGVTLKSAGSWCSHFLECKDVRVTGVTIHNRVNGNNDGIDLMSTSQVRISDCTIICGDDAICFQAMSDTLPVEDIVITNCILSTRWAAIRSGGAHRGGIRNVTVSNCVIRDTWGCGIKLQISGNASMENMTFSNITMPRVSCPISIRYGNAHYNNEKRDEAFPHGAMRNIMFSSIWASVVSGETLRSEVPHLFPNEERQCMSICGIPGHPVEGISLSDIHVVHPGGGTNEDAANVNSDEHEDDYPEYFMWGVLPAYGLYVRHGRGITLSNCRFDLQGDDARPAVVCDDVDGLDVLGLVGDLSSGAASLVATRGCSDTSIDHARIKQQPGTDRLVAHFE